MSACAVVGLLAVAPLHVASATSVVDCRAMADDQRRLACYDAAVDQLIGAPEDTPAADAEPAPPPAPPAVAKDVSPLPERPSRRALQDAAFGAEQLPESRRPDVMPSTTLDQLDAIVTRVERKGGVVKVWLDNGQVWRQTDNYYFPVEDGDGLSVPVVIKPRIFGGYRLSPRDTKRFISVERLR